MSAEAMAVSAGAFSWDLELRHKRAQIFRLAFGMMLSAGIALGIAWPLSFITPVLTAKLLSLPRVPPMRQGVALIVILSASFLASAMLLMPMLAYPAVYTLLLGLILFLLFYAKAGGANPILIVFMMIGVLVVPLVGTVSQALARGVVSGLIFAAVVSVAMVYITAAIFPDPPGLPAQSGAGSGGGAGTAEIPEPRTRVGLALRSLVVIFPLAFLFLLFSATDLAVVLIFAGLLGLEPTFGTHLKAGKGLILANLAGGLVAVAVYNILTWVPAFPFFLLLILLAGLWVGRWIFSDHPLGKLLGGGITTVFVVLGPVVTGDAEAGAKLYLRVAMIMAAVLYVVLAFGLLERLTRGRRMVET
jgi:hypothetical protein